MLRYILAAMVLCGCAGSSRVPLALERTGGKCPLDENFNPSFLEGRKPLPNGMTCLSFPIRNTDRISSWFRDERHAFTAGRHTGIDVPVPVGTIVVAPTSGRVTYARATDIDTNIVSIDIGGGWSVMFAHLRIISVTEGQKLVAGQVVGLSGGAVGDPGSGPCTNGPHLHYALRFKGDLADPLAYSCLR